MPYKLQPSDSIYAILAQQAYFDSGYQTIDHLPSEWQVLKIQNQSMEDGFFGVAYVHQANQEIIIAYRGTELPGGNINNEEVPQQGFARVSHFLSSALTQLKSSLADIHTGIQGVIRLMVTSQQISALEFALAIKAQYPGHRLSFTGYSLGAWLAQIVLYHFMVEYEKTKDPGFQTRCVTLDGPGVKNILEDMHARYSDVIPASKLATFLERLNITNYLSSPNLINCCNTHLGTIYRLYVNFPEETNLREKFKNYLYYTNYSHNKDNLLAQFDKTTGKPIRRTQVIDWPRIQWPTQAGELSLENPIQSLLQSINQNLPGFKLPDFFVNLAAKGLDAGVKKLINASSTTQGFYAIAQMLTDLISGKVDKTEYEGFFSFAHSRNQYEPEADLNFRSSYQLQHQYHYAVEPVNPKRLHLRHTSDAFRRFVWTYSQPNEANSVRRHPLCTNLPETVWQDITGFTLITGSLVQKKGWLLTLTENNTSDISTWHMRIEQYLIDYPALLSALSANALQQAEALYKIDQEVGALKTDIQNLNMQVREISQGYRYQGITDTHLQQLKETMQAVLKRQYISKENIDALFGKPFKLEGQYINVQMLYQNEKIEKKKNYKKHKIKNQ